MIAKTINKTLLLNLVWTFLINFYPTHPLLLIWICYLHTQIIQEQPLIQQRWTLRLSQKFSKVLEDLKELQETIWKIKSFKRMQEILAIFRMGLFRAAHRKGEGKKTPLLKICHTYPTMMKHGPFLPYLKKIQEIYKWRDRSLEFYWHQHFFTGN